MKKTQFCVVITYFLWLTVTCKTTLHEVPESDHKAFFLLGQAGYRWSVSVPGARRT